jgi:hypothetical protein
MKTKAFAPEPISGMLVARIRLAGRTADTESCYRMWQRGLTSTKLMESRQTEVLGNKSLLCPNLIP